MEVKKYDKIVLDSSRSIDDIVAGIKAELSKQESQNAGESYICYVSHAYSSGENAGVNYIVVSDEFKNLNRLSSNVIQANAYTKDEINELIARVEAQIPVDEANLATKEEVNEINSTLTDAINTINTKANTDAVVNLTDDQTIEGVKTFSVVPVVATQPTDDNQLANKAYVDSKSSEITRLTDAIATKANADAVVNLTSDQTINGVKTFTSNITSPNITAMQNNLNTIFSPTSSPVKTQTTNKIITVGTGGDFQDLLSAVNEAKKYTSPVEINLISNLEVNQSIVIGNVNGRHIHINFQNYKITNTSSNAAQLFITASAIGAFYNLNLENMIFLMAESTTMLIGNININNSTSNNYSPIDLFQSSILTFSYNAVLTVNDSINPNLILSQTGSIISFPAMTINSTTNTGNLLAIFNGGFLSLHSNTTINKPSQLNLYNTAINTPSGNGLILDKTGRS